MEKMKCADALSSVLKRGNMTKGRVARIIGITPQSVQCRFNADMKISSVVEIAQIVNYEVAIVPSGVKLPHGSIVIE